MKSIEQYSACFSSLHTAKKLGIPAPHKAVLLLSVIDLIECGVIVSFPINRTDLD